MKCPKCGSTDDVKVVEDSAILIKAECGVCGRSFNLIKVAIGKNHDLFFYFDKLREKLLEHNDIAIEARGNLIPKMLVIAGNIVLKDKLARMESVDVVFTVDKRNEVVATETILLKGIVQGICCRK